MKNVILGIVIGAVLFIPVGTYALNYANTIYRVSAEEGTISVFDDGPNKCYVAVSWDDYKSEGNNRNVSISCLRK